MDIFSIYDLFLVPIYILAFVFVAYLLKKTNKKRKKYFLPSLLAHLFSVVVFSTVTYSIYGEYNDTFSYYKASQEVRNVIIEEPSSLYRFISSATPDDLSQEYLNKIKFTKKYLRGTSTFFIVKITAFLSFLSFNSYLVISLFFSIFSFLGVWRFYNLMVDFYPKLYKELALVILFFPSTLFWGTGLLKDSLTLGALFLFINSFANLFIYKKKKAISLSLILITGYVMLTIKLYILLMILPALIVWKFSHLLKRIPLHIDRYIIGFFVLTIFSFTGYFLLKSLSNVIERYAFENVVDNMIEHQNYIKRASSQSGGAAFDDFKAGQGIVSILKGLPKAINATLFRPYLWESRKIVMLLSGVENFMLLLLSIIVLIKLGLLRILKTIRNNPLLLMGSIFVFLFAFVVGFTTPNFGSLSRYKIPVLPIYGSILVILYNKKKK